MRVAVSFLLFFTLIFNQASGDCYNECMKVFNLSPLMLPLCNNSAIMSSNLALNSGLRATTSNGPQWWLPNGSPTVTSSQINSVTAAFADGDELKKYLNREIIPGVYSYMYGAVLTTIGIYLGDDENNLEVDITASLSIDDYFNQSSFKLNLVCTTMNYPPTCVTWSRNDELYSNYTSSSTEVISNTSTIYTSKISVRSTDVIGRFTCAVISNGTLLHNNSDTVYVEGSPHLVQAYQLVSDDTLIIKTVVQSYAVYYKEADADISNTSLCDNLTLSCTLHEVYPGNTYSIVITTMNEDDSDTVYLPTQPYSITIKEPDPIDNASIVLSFTDRGTAKIEWGLTLLQSSTIVRFSASCLMTECSSGVIINNVSNSSYITNLIDGLNYTLFLMAANVLGNSSETEFHIIQNHTAPSVPVTGLDSETLNSSSFIVSWELVSCCNASGEDPSYQLILTNNNEAVVHNVIVSPGTTSYTFTGLESRFIYSLTIKAKNSIGSGPEEQLVGLVTPMVNGTDATTVTPVTITEVTTDSTTLPVYLIILSGSVAVVLSIAVVCICMIICIAYIPKKTKSGVKKESNEEEIALNPLSLNFTSPVYSPVELKKSQAPYVIEFPANTKAIEGETVHLLVQVSGQPDPTYTWTHQGEPLLASSHNKTQIFSDGTLVIKDIQPEDAGQYDFSARNVGGELNRVVILTVLPGAVDEDSIEDHQIQEARSLIIDHKPIPVGTLEKYVEMQHSSDNNPFNILYASLGRDNDRPLTKANANKSKNRYKNIVPYDDNLIELQPILGWSEFQNEYINASYIDGYHCKNKFIATQGPTSATIGDFWRMIWQEKSHVIVMLTNTIEGNRVKCQEYWPSSPDDDIQVGPYVIQVADEEEAYANFVIRSFKILLTDGSQLTHHVQQFQYTAWPDHGVPDHGSPLVTFTEKVMSYHAKVKGPITTHCSAGVGRTGTFIALDIGLEQIKSEKQIDFIQIINQMREQRMKMVQTSGQFIFLHDTLLEQVLCGNTLIPVGKFSETIMTFDYSDCNSRMTIYETQYQLIKRLTPKTNAYKCDTGKNFIEKNRSHVLLPSDTRRVVLLGCEYDYINASYVDGYQKKKEFIIAQSPLQQTTNDFWKMIVQHKTSTIVMLCDLSEDSKVVCHRYWPDSSSVVFDYISVKMINEVEESSTIIRRTFGIKDMNSGYCSTVVQLQLTNWLPDGQCANYGSIGDLYTLVTDNQRRSGSNKPVIVHCSDCITRSAMYCAAHNAIEQAKLEQGSDLFQIIKTLRIQRPGSISSQKCYETVHELVNSYLSNFAMYSQFH